MQYRAAAKQVRYPSSSKGRPTPSAMTRANSAGSFLSKRAVVDETFPAHAAIQISLTSKGASVRNLVDLQVLNMADKLLGVNSKTLSFSFCRQGKNNNYAMSLHMNTCMWKLTVYTVYGTVATVYSLPFFRAPWSNF